MENENMHFFHHYLISQYVIYKYMYMIKEYISYQECFLKQFQIIQQNLNETDVQPGYCQFGGPGSNVLVTLKWKKTMEARTKNFKPAHTVKKYIDGFFNPWDLQGLTSGSLAGMTGDKKEIFEALECKLF
jgi:hypothetical protein